MNKHREYIGFTLVLSLITALGLLAFDGEVVQAVQNSIVDIIGETNEN